MKRNIKTTFVAVAMVSFGCSFLDSKAARADLLDGQTVKITIGVYFGTLLVSETSGPVVVGPGTEIANFAFRDLGGDPDNYLDIDLSDTNILITNRGAEFDCLDCYLRFEDAYGTIPRFTGVTVNPATTWPGYDSIGFHPNSIGLDLHGGFPGAQLSLDITGMIPEPSAACLMLTGLIVTVSRRWLRQSAATLSRKVEPCLQP
jgi:hypothetical protein